MGFVFRIQPGLHFRMSKRRRLSLQLRYVYEEEDLESQDGPLTEYLNSVAAKIEEGKELRLKYINNSFTLISRQWAHNKSIPFGT